MRVRIHTELDYRFAEPTDILLQLEAAIEPGQYVEHAWIDLSDGNNFARVPAQDGIGDRLWLRVEQRLVVDYRATVAITRTPADWRALPRVAPHCLPADVVQYLMGSRYCASDQFDSFVEAEFAGREGGALVAAIRDWVEAHFTYVRGVSDADTTAIDSFVRRQGVCRDYSHVMIALVRAAGIPARMASVYALGVKPQDFHAVVEVFLGGGWHLIDPTGMAVQGSIARIGVGRDAADIAFMTSFGTATLNRLSVQVEQVG
ncbi:MAG: transglutaminase [Sphingomonas sp.]|nr:transglutaminase [Sphingomonas sp.]